MSFMLLRRAFTTPPFAFTISSNTLSTDVRTLALAAGWDGARAVVCTVATGFYCYASGGSGTGLTVSGAFPSGVQLIISAGAAIYGGPGIGDQTGGAAGGAGGIALNAQVAVTVTNNGTIAGGGGGGGAGGLFNDPSNVIPGTFLGGTGGNGAWAGGSATAGQQATPFGLSGTFGGNGGALGTAGSAGQGSGYAGGAAGYSVNGNSNITWLATGTRTGPIA